MAALASSASSIQRDIRSDSRSYKRDKDQSSKWAMGSRPSYGVRKSCWEPDVFLTGSPEQQAKIRPQKKYSDYYHCRKTRGNDLITYEGQNAHRARIARKKDALNEVASGPSLSRSLSDLLPSPSASTGTSSIDSGVLYSFDAPSTPSKVVGLNSLVEKAEMEWQNRETDKIVRDEYEILDESGEVKVAAKSKGKKGSPRQRAKLLVVQDEDDWETI